MTTTEALSRTTMRQIATAAEVSPATVSYVLNRTQGRTVADETRQRVLKIATRMGYQRSVLNRAIKSPLRHIGISVVDTERAEYTFLSEIFNGVRARAMARGYLTMLLPMPPLRDLEDWRPAYNRMVELHQSSLVDGFILDRQRSLTRTNEELVRYGVAAVMVNGGPGGPVVLPSVTINDLAGAQLAMRHLLELGHWRIGHVKRNIGHSPCVDEVSYPIARLLEGYTKSLESAQVKVDPALIVTGDPLDRERTEKAVFELMQLPDRPTALFVGDDLMAVVAINTLRQIGLRVPEDVSVIGYGDWKPAGMVAAPALTTVHAPLRDNGCQAVDLLIDMIEGKVSEPRRAVLEPHLVVRSSTARRAATS